MLILQIITGKFVLFYLLVFYQQIVEDHGCYRKAKKPKLPKPNASQKFRSKIFWQVPKEDEARNKKWLEEYANKSTTDKEAGFGGQEPVPWAYVSGLHGKPAYCFEDPDIGKCWYNLTRWAYNPYTRECQQFRYTGCSGNFNNFFNQRRCEEECKKETQNNCDKLPAEYNNNEY